MAMSSAVLNALISRFQRGNARWPYSIAFPLAASPAASPLALVASHGSSFGWFVRVSPVANDEKEQKLEIRLFHRPCIASSHTTCNDLCAAATTAQKNAQLLNEKLLVSLQRRKFVPAMIIAGQGVEGIILAEVPRLVLPAWENGYWRVFFHIS
jgi:hypothetical protein